MSIDKKIFVVGVPRSGTTWIGQWLRRHPEIYGGPETHMFAILHNLMNPEWSQGLKTWLKRDDLMDEIRKFTLACFEKSIFRGNKKHVVEHSALHYNHIDFIRQIFPDSLFIHPYRDGRNVIESHMRTFGNDNYIVYIQKWINTMNDMLRKPRPYVLNIKYEDIVNDTSVSRKITDFLCLEHHYDIDSWEFPVNTPNFEYDLNRWENLHPEVKEHFNKPEFSILLKKFKYAN